MDFDIFFDSLKKSSFAILFLDYDGTLAPFHINPSEAKPYPGITELIEEIMKTTTKVVIISGRDIDHLKPLLGMKKLPEIWGSHGGERLTEDKKYSKYSLSADQTEGLQQGWAAAIKYVSENRCEKKALSIAVHWRGCEEKEKQNFKNKVEEAWKPLADSKHLEIHHFDEGIELRPLGIDKGKVIKTILKENQQKPYFPIAYLGDDKTDEEAFAILRDRGLKVLVSNNFKDTAADLQIHPPDELMAFLKKWARYAK